MFFNVNNSSMVRALAWQFKGLRFDSHYWQIYYFEISLTQLNAGVDDVMLRDTKGLSIYLKINGI